jgi:murein hydrolase activator
VKRGSTRRGEPGVIPTRRRLFSAAVAALLLAPGGLPQAAPERPNAERPETPSQDAEIAQLANARQQAVAAARTVQQRQRGLAALELAVAVMEQGATAKQKEFDQNRTAQEQLLAALERLARAPPEEIAFAPEGPIDRIRSRILITAAIPALQAQARSLAGDLASLAKVRALVDERRPEVDAARQALAQAQNALAEAIARRTDLIGRLLPDDGKIQSVAQEGDQASDLFDLIKRVDADVEQHDKDRLIQLHTALPVRKKAGTPVLDPTRPADLRALDAPRTTMVWPIIGDVVHRFGEADRFGRPNQGLTMNVPPASVVVAPFDGRVDYAGRFRDYGPILIIRHGGGYHSVLAGLGRVDVTTGQWLLAGEPVGVMPGADDKDASTTFYLELRRDGRPVDPQSRLASRDDKAEDSQGNSAEHGKVGE